MASLIASYSGTPGPAGGSTTPINTTGANFIVICVSGDGASYVGPGTPTDTYNNTWVMLTDRNSGTRHTRLIYAKNALVGPNHVFTITTGVGNGYMPIIVLAWSGMTSNPFDKESGAGGFKPLPTGSITPTAAALIVSGFGAGTNIGTVSVDNALTQITVPYSAGVSNPGALGYKILSTPAAINPSWTWGDNNDAAVSVASFLIVAGPPPSLGSAYADQVRAYGASAYWRLGETSGTTAKDSINGYDGAISGGVTLNQPGALADGNPAMRFDGTTGLITVAQAAYSAFGTGPASWECWVKQVALPTGSGYAVECGYVFALKGVGFILDSTAVRALVGSGVATMAVLLYGADSIDPLAWHHLVGVLTRGANDTLLFYVDGVLRKSVTLASAGTNISGARPLGLGSYVGNSSGSDWFNGVIDEVAIYPTALTAQQIADHYAAAFLNPAAPPSRVTLPNFAVLPTQWFPLTPSDVTDRPFVSLRVGAAGDLAVVRLDGTVVPFTAVPAGKVLPIAGRRVNNTGTTATQIVCLEA